MLLIALMLSKRKKKPKKQNSKKEVIELICILDWIIIQYILDQIIGC